MLYTPLTVLEVGSLGGLGRKKAGATCGYVARATWQAGIPALPGLHVPAAPPRVAITLSACYARRPKD